MPQSKLQTEIISPELLKDAIAWRRHLHRHPEVAYQERETSNFVASRLEEFGLSVHRGLAGTGVVGTLSRGVGGRTIGIRADMDALSIQEESGVAHASSVPGVMHACGHDGHTAMLLAAARACVSVPNLKGTVHFIFQPAEENECGGKRMVEEGLFERFPCEAVYALHNRPTLPLGSCIAPDGPLRAAFGVFEIGVRGKGCHGAHPHEGTDVLLAASHLHVALQSIVSRTINPQKAAVLSVTQVQGGTSWNTIPGACTLRGTTRWFDDEEGDLIERRLEGIANSVAAAFGCEARVRYERRIPVTVNDPGAAATLRSIAQSPALNLQVVDAVPVMGSDDFAFMLQACPGAYLLLGSGRGADEPSLHSPFFDFNDEILPLGVRLWVTLVENALSGHQE